MKQDSYRNSQMKIGWTEGTRLHMGAFLVEDHSCIATLVERVRSDDTLGK